MATSFEAQRIAPIHENRAMARLYNAFEEFIGNYLRLNDGVYGNFVPWLFG